MRSDLTRIRAALESAGALEVLPPATEAQVASFELRLGVALPEDYRAFLCEVSEGILIDGEPIFYTPDAVLLDLGPGKGISFPPGRDPAAPFLYNDADATALRHAMSVISEQRTLMEDLPFMQQQRKAATEGCITLGYNGGNDFSVLVVTGEQRGLMWRTGEIDYPETLAGYSSSREVQTPLGFLAWFELWAVSALPGVEKL